VLAKALGLLSSALAATAPLAAAAELRVPGNTAYGDPSPDGVRPSRRGESARWTDPGSQLVWFGEFRTAGTVTCQVEIVPRAEAAGELTLSLAGQSVNRRFEPGEEAAATVEFGGFEIGAPGYHRVELAASGVQGTAPDVVALVLGGHAVETAHFNLKPRRNAASVHLFYPVQDGAEVDAFYCEVTGLEDPLWTFYMACGWHRGYFGMQVNSPTERRVIFSVWDSGDEPVDREKVAEEDQVVLVDKGEDVVAESFGNEGTGGHSHLKFNWKTGEPQRFLVTAEPDDATHTTYSGYYFRPDLGRWTLISAWRAPKDGGYLRGLHSFSENFAGQNGHLLRKARFGNQWARTTDGQWSELTTARFSHDPTGKSDRLDRFAGVEDGDFFLSHGGFVPGSTAYGAEFQRPPKGSPPEVDLSPKQSR
jgi:hypothetical protein